MLCVYEVVTFANVTYYFGASAMPYQFWESFAFLGFAVCSALGLAFLFSSIFKNGAVSMLFSAALLLYGFTLLGNVIQRLTSLEPWFLLSYGAGIMENILVTPYPLHAITANGHTIYAATVPEGLLIMIGYFAVGLVVSLLIFKRREFN